MHRFKLVERHKRMFFVPNLSLKTTYTYSYILFQVPLPFDAAHRILKRSKRLTLRRLKFKFDPELLYL